MRLYSKAIINWCDVNMYTTGNQWSIRAGDPNTLYFQLIDLDQNGLRYVAGVGTANQPASMLVTFMSIDQSNVIQIAAQQDPNDGSIWSVPISPAQVLFGGNVQFQLTQANMVRNWIVTAMLCVEYPVNCGSDGQLADVNVFNYNPFTNSGTGV